MAIIDIKEFLEAKRKVHSLPEVLEDLVSIKDILSKHIDMMRCRILYHDIIQLEIDYKRQLDSARRVCEEKGNTRSNQEIRS